MTAVNWDLPVRWSNGVKIQRFEHHELSETTTVYPDSNSGYYDCVFTESGSTYTADPAKAHLYDVRRVVNFDPLDDASDEELAKVFRELEGRAIDVANRLMKRGYQIVDIYDLPLVYEPADAIYKDEVTTFRINI